MRQIAVEPVRDWNDLRRVRRSLVRWLADIDATVRDSLTIAASELIENGLLHGDASRENPVVLEILQEGQAIELRVTAVLHSTDRANSVLERVDAIQNAPDKHQAYVERLLELARAPQHGTSKLGLHRVALEGGCSLRAEHKNDQLTVTARRAL